MAGNASPSVMAAIKVDQLNHCSSLEEQQQKAREILDWMSGYETRQCKVVEDFQPFRQQLRQIIAS
ncbi:MAG: hypothetical protein WD970_00295 [Patescibacteria group bacterium]